MTTYPRPMKIPGRHIVQVVRDIQLLDSTKFPEATERQERYLSMLRERHPTLAMTLIVLTKTTHAEFSTASGLHIIPIQYNRLSALPKVYLVLRQVNSLFKIDLITTQTVAPEAWSAAFFARRFRIPILGQIHSDPLSGSKIRRSFMKMLLRLTLPLFDRIRVVSPAIAAEVSLLAPSLPIVVAPVPSFGVDQFVATSQANVEISSPTILFVGRFTPEKQLSDWVEIAKQLSSIIPQARFCLIGDGECLDAVRRQVEELALTDKLKILPWCDQYELVAYYRLATVQLLTSASEGFSRVVVEGFLQGLPCVAPRLATLSDRIIDDQTGYLYEPGNLSEAVKFLAAILQDPSLRLRLSAAASQLGQEFAPNILARRWIDLLEQTCERSHQGAER